MGLLTRLRTPPPLPEDFLFGVANADHQVEAYDEPFADIRDIWEVRLRQTLRGRATDFWNRYPEDVELARGLGCRMFRFGVSWARVESPQGTFRQEALEHYRQVAETIRAAGLEPMPTLLHFTWPVHLEERGGMTSEDFPGIFAAYAEEVARALGDAVRYWITINEPTLLPFGYIKPWWQSEYAMPPGLPPEATLEDEVDAIRKLIRNLFRAHAAARDAIKGVNAGALVGANPALLGLPPWVQRLTDRNATHLGSLEQWVAKERRFAERPLLKSAKADVVVATLTRTRGRADLVDFSDVYFKTGQALLVPQASPAQAPEDLAGKRVAAVRGTTAERDIRRIPDVELVLFETTAEALAALDAGGAEAVRGDEIALRALMRPHPERYRLLPGRLTEEPYAVAVTKGNTELRKAVDLVVRRFVSEAGWTRYVAEPQELDLPPPREEQALATVDEQAERAASAKLPAVPGTSLADLRARGRIVIAVRDEVPGVGYRDPKSGEWSGFEVDLARAIADHVLGPQGKLELVPTTSKRRISLLQPFAGWFDSFLRPLSVVSSVLTTNWWNLGLAGRLPEFLCPPECVRATDFVGFDYYWGIGSVRLRRVEHLIAALTAGHYDVAPVWPRGLYVLLKKQAELLPATPLVIVENGCVDVADGVGRAEYLRRHVREVQRARADGIDVVGYVCWSITSNREWGLAFGPSSDFGLYHVDLDTDPQLRRVPTDAAPAYASMIAARSAAPAP